MFQISNIHMYIQHTFVGMSSLLYLLTNYSNEKVKNDKEMSELVRSLEKDIKMSESTKNKFCDEILKKSITVLP